MRSPFCSARAHARLPRGEVRDVGEVGEDLLRRPGDLDASALRAWWPRIRSRACWTTAFAPSRAPRARGRRRTGARPAGGAPRAPGRARRPAGFSSRSSRRRPTARCSRSAARAATRRSGSPPASATSAGASSRSSTTRARSRRGAANVEEAGLERVGRAARRRRARAPSADRGRVRRRVHRRGEGGLRGVFALARGKVEPGGLFVADNVLSHADPLAQYSAARTGRPDAAQRHRPARPRARAELSSCASRSPSVHCRYRGKEVVRQ